MLDEFQKRELREVIKKAKADGIEPLYLTTDNDIVAEANRRLRSRITPEKQPKIASHRQRRCALYGFPYELDQLAPGLNDSHFEALLLFGFRPQLHDELRGYYSHQRGTLADKGRKWHAEEFWRINDLPSYVCVGCNRPFELKDLRVKKNRIVVCRGCSRRGVKVYSHPGWRERLAALLTSLPKPLTLAQRKQRTRLRRMLAIVGNPPVCPTCRQIVPVALNGYSIGQRWTWTQERSGGLPECRRCSTRARMATGVPTPPAAS